MPNPDGPNILITGISRGIGLALARSFLGKGWTVFGLSRSVPPLAHERFRWQSCDLSSAAATAAAIADWDTAFDAVIHNAAVLGPMGKALDIPSRGWRETFDVNFFAPLEITRLVLPLCREKACFIFFSGGGAVTAKPWVGPYALSKLALVKLVEQLALEYPEFRFYALAPGAVDTAIFREHHKRSGGPMPRFTAFGEIERLIGIFLDDTERLLNGRLVHVRDDLEALRTLADGGYIRRVEVLRPPPSPHHENL